MNKVSMVLAAAAGLASICAGHQAQAQSIRYEVKVAGYSSAGWIEVRNGANVGGRVIRDGSGVWTDRVSRGEDLRVTITDGRAPQVTSTCAILGVTASGGLGGNVIVRLPFQATFTVTRNPSIDNVHINIYNPYSGGYTDRRIPIGTR